MGLIYDIYLFSSKSTIKVRTQFAAAGSGSPVERHSHSTSTKLRRELWYQNYVWFRHVDCSWLSWHTPACHIRRRLKAARQLADYCVSATYRKCLLSAICCLLCKQHDNRRRCLSVSEPGHILYDTITMQNVLICAKLYWRLPDQLCLYHTYTYRLHIRISFWDICNLISYICN